MKEQKKKITVAMNPLYVGTTILLALKITKVISWRWIWVLLPAIVSITLSIFYTLYILIRMNVLKRRMAKRLGKEMLEMIFEEAEEVMEEESEENEDGADND